MTRRVPKPHDFADLLRFERPQLSVTARRLARAQTVADLRDCLAPHQMRHPQLLGDKVVHHGPNRPLRTRRRSVPLIIPNLVNHAIDEIRGTIIRQTLPADVAAKLQAALQG